LLGIAEDGGADLIKEKSDRYCEINERLQNIDSDEAETVAIKILNGLGFSNSDLSKKTREFSGGWRMRISLAKALYAKPDILLLDEPTNHLDMHAVMWLEDYLFTWPYTIMIVSHARSFINNVATDVINFVDQKFVYYKGNYDDFLKARKERNANMTKTRERDLKRIEGLQSFIDRFRANAKRASLAQSKIKMIAKMDVAEEVYEDPDVIFIFPEVEQLASPLLRLVDVSLGYNKKNLIIEKTNFYVDQQSRIAVVGPNGAGKSTLMKCLHNQLQELEGKIYRHPKLKIAMFTQHHIDQLDLEITPLDTIALLGHDLKPEFCRFHLAGFGIQGELAVKPNYMLSGGQKSRVALAALVYVNPHIIIMDEPTNHMDIDSVNALAIALGTYNGGLVIVSHDEFFVESVCDQIWTVGKKKCIKYEGTFQEYRKLVRKGMH
jgi:ATP-binding cassette subfamily F protein 3